MDFQKDYILRMIQMMGDLMRRIGERMDDWERNRMLSDTCRDLCGMTLETGEKLDTESLREMLAPIPRLMMAELLCAKAEAVSLPAYSADDLRLKALRLLASLHAESNICDLRAEKLVFLKACVYDTLTAQDLMDCARFFFQAERYDEMEDALFQALELESDGARDNDRKEAVELLRRASKATEYTLALCHMTDRELRESAHELETEFNDTIHEQESPE